MIQKSFTVLVVLIGLFAFMFCALGLTTEIRAITTADKSLFYAILSLMATVGLMVASMPIWWKRVIA